MIKFYFKKKFIFSNMCFILIVYFLINKIQKFLINRDKFLDIFINERILFYINFLFNNY